MSTVPAQIWRGATFTIERSQNPAADAVIFRFSGPFTARDMYSSLTPLALRNIFESDPPHHAPNLNIFDATRPATAQNHEDRPTLSHNRNSG
jgi:hypothetical protein